jgi:hypothetical protein
MIGRVTTQLPGFDTAAVKCLTAVFLSDGGDFVWALFYSSINSQIALFSRNRTAAIALDRAIPSCTPPIMLSSLVLCHYLKLAKRPYEISQPAFMANEALESRQHKARTRSTSQSGARSAFYRFAGPSNSACFRPCIGLLPE